MGRSGKRIGLTFFKENYYNLLAVHLYKILDRIRVHTIVIIDY
jgi:hypothetical protein